MFRLDVSHLQAPTLTLPDALSTLGSHRVYMWITYLLELFGKVNNYRVIVICRLCLSMKPLQHKTPSYVVRWCSLDVQPWDAVVTLQFGVFVRWRWVEFSWRFFFWSICYNRTGAFLVAGIYLIEYDREFVILLVNLLVRVIIFRCFSVFHPLWLVLFHTVDVNVFSFWRCLALFLFTVLWPLCGRLANCPVYCLCGCRFFFAYLQTWESPSCSSLWLSNRQTVHRCIEIKKTGSAL